MFLEVRRSLRLLRVSLRHGLPLLARTLLRLPPTAGGPAGALRRALEDMGLTYLKFGQFLAMRIDLLPMEVCRELGKLFERVPPMTFAVVQRTVETELRGSLAERFAGFHKEPLASASVAQVHEALTREGRRVAVKVQRPGIERIFAADMRVLRSLAGVLEVFGLAGASSLREALEEFGAFTRREMDFLLEGRAADLLREESAGSAVIPAVIPEVHWSLTTRRVLTLQFLDGLSLYRITDLLERGETDALRAQLPDLDVARVLHDFSFALLRQIFLRGFFHGDPHPGNLMVLKDGRVAFVDFGISGSLTRGQRLLLARYFASLAAGNIDTAFRHYAKLFTPTPETDLAAFERDQKRILERWYRATRDPLAPLEDRSLGKLTMDEIEVLRRNKIRMSMDTLLFWRTIFALDSTGLRLSPDFRLLNELRDFLTGAASAAETPDPAAWTPLLVAAAKALQPSRLRERLGGLARRDRAISLRLSPTAGESRSSSHLARWVAAGLLAASALIGLARLGPSLWGASP